MSKYHSGLKIDKIDDVLKKENARIHFTGVGGVGMYSLFKLSEHLGYSVSGSDIEESGFFNMAKREGNSVVCPHKRENAEGKDMIVYSLAISDDNPEILYCEEMGIPAVSRAEYLGAVMQSYKNRIGVSGTHGKSTVTAMIDAIFKAAGASFTTLIGAPLPDVRLPYRFLGGDTLVYEACEYKDSFLYFHPTLSVFLNLEFDHVDYFPDIDAVKKSFLSAINRSEHSIINCDDENLSEISKDVGSRVTTFGMSKKADYRVAVSSAKRGIYKLKFTYKKKQLCDLTLSMPGVHNVMNACAAFAAAMESGISPDVIKTALEAFFGIERRLEVIGNYNGAVVYYDYAHHPTEIACSIKTVRELVSGDVTVIFKPHTYSRTKGLMSGFAEALAMADRVLLSEISAIREEKIYGVTSEVLASHIGGHAEYVCDENIIHKLKDINGGAVIIMGAANLDFIKDKIINSEDG